MKWASVGDFELRLNSTFVFNDVAGFDTAWQHLAITRTGAAMTLYRNGVALASASDGSVLRNDGCVVRLGSIANCAGAAGLQQAWSGQLDDVRVYSRGLSAAEVDLLVNASLSMPDVGSANRAGFRYYSHDAVSRWPVRAGPSGVRATRI